jgi:hypothetical protein
MDELKPLAEEGDAFERALLESAHVDVGSRLAESSCLLLLEGATAPAPTLAASLLSKKLMLVLGAGLVTSAVLVALWSASPSARRPVVPDSSGAALAPHEPAPPASPRPELAVPSAQVAPVDPPQVTSETPEVPARTRAAAPARASGRSLAEEVALLQSVRRALAAGDAAVALSALDRHTREFKRGVLQLEAGVLRVQALLAHGDKRAAHAWGQQFLSSHPEGPHATRVRNMLASTGQP